MFGFKIVRRGECREAQYQRDLHARLADDRLAQIETLEAQLAEAQTIADKLQYRIDEAKEAAGNDTGRTSVRRMLAALDSEAP